MTRHLSLLDRLAAWWLRRNACNHFYAYIGSAELTATDRLDVSKCHTCGKLHFTHIEYNLYPSPQMLKREEILEKYKCDS